MHRTWGYIFDSESYLDFEQDKGLCFLQSKHLQCDLQYKLQAYVVVQCKIFQCAEKKYLLLILSMRNKQDLTTLVVTDDSSTIENLRCLCVLALANCKQLSLKNLSFDSC